MNLNQENNFNLIYDYNNRKVRNNINWIKKCYLRPFIIIQSLIINVYYIIKSALHKLSIYFILNKID